MDTTTKTTDRDAAKKARDAEKLVDLPPHGPRNPDPLTNTPGSHPIETGIGAVLGGAASGLVVGAVGGPVGALVGAIAGGAIAGGLAGKGVGELIDPTTEDNWIRNLLAGKPEPTGQWETDARQAYRFGWRAESRHPRHTFAQAESGVRAEWEAEFPTGRWDTHRSHVRDGYEQGRSVNGTNVE